MKIKKMTATFGTLQNSELTLEDGLNILELPNEGGKSTWCAFLTAMLYGVNSTERGRAGYLPDKTHYQPWSGSPMAGSMELEWQGRDVTLYRRSNRDKPMQDFAAMVSGTMEKVPELTGKTAGETLCGVSKSVFQRSAFIGQNALGVDGTPELEKRIAAMVSSGEEDSSFSEAETRLREWQRKRKYNRYGALPETERALEEVRQRIGSLASAGEDLLALRAEAAQCEEKVNRLKTEVEASRKAYRRETLDTMSRSREKLAALEKNAAEAAVAHRNAEHDCEDGPFLSLFREKGKDLKATVEQDEARARTLENRKAPAGAGLAAVLLCLILALVTAGLTVFLPLPVFVYAVAVLFLALAVFFFLRRRNAQKLWQEEGETLQSLLQPYGVSSADELQAAFSRFCAALAAEHRCAAEEQEAQALLETAREEQKTLNSSLLSGLDFSHGDSEPARKGQQLREMEERLRVLRETIAREEGSRRVLGDPVVLAAETAELEQRREELSEQLEALTLALDTLCEANSEIQNRFAPRLSARAGEILNEFTGGSFDGVSFDRSFAAMLKKAEEPAPHEMLYFSRGSLDQMYLALRLAICELVLPETEKCPLILDDALTNFDDERCKAVLAYLKKLSHERQILLFTCHSREKRLLAELA